MTFFWLIKHVFLGDKAKVCGAALTSATYKFKSGCGSATPFQIRSRIRRAARFSVERRDVSQLSAPAPSLIFFKILL